MKKKYTAQLWAGSDEAYEIFASAQERALTLDAAAYPSAVAISEDTLLELHGNLGVIQIKGVLTDREAWFNEYFGLISYSKIQEALYQAVANPAVHEILLDVGSPGGTVNGITGMADAVATAAAAKPMTVFAESCMCSGAIWLTVPVKNQFVGALATIGSIGVVAKHTETSKMMADMGVTTTVVRAGAFKQLVNSSEPLTAESKKVLQDSVDYAYGIFLQTIADYKGITCEKVDTQMAQGKEFTGQQAVDAGLVTAVSTFDEVFTTIQNRVNKNNPNNGGPGMQKKYVLTQAVALAAAASGVVLDVNAADATAQPTPEEIAAAVALQAGEESAEATTQAASTDTPEPTAMDLLRSQAVEKDEQIFALKTDLAKAQDATGEIDALKEIAAKSVNNMLVALGGSAVDFSTMSASDIVAQHATASARFVTEFKVGGVAATASEDAETAPVKKVATASRLDLAKSKLAVKV